jgi:hypothetical protein
MKMKREKYGLKVHIITKKSKDKIHRLMFMSSSHPEYIK